MFKRILPILFFLFPVSFIIAQTSQDIILPEPNLERGYPVMKALSLRASASEWKTDAITHKDLSDLLWAANGINRPETGKRTAPSAFNAQDVDIYVFMREGVFLYNASKHLLEIVVAGDYRDLVAYTQVEVSQAPLICVLVSDVSKITDGEEQLRLSWSTMDAAIVSQNISIFCASVGLATRPRAHMNNKAIRKLLRLSDSQYLMLNNPVSH